MRILNIGANMGSMKGKQAKIDAVFGRLADMIQSGNLLAGTDPVGFLDTLAEDDEDDYGQFDDEPDYPKDCFGCYAPGTEVEQRLSEAHRQGWEQAKRKAIAALIDMADTHVPSFDAIAAMEYKGESK